MVMEFMKGGELMGLLRQRKTFNEDVTRFYAAELILALEYLHSIGVI